MGFENTRVEDLWRKIRNARIAKQREMRDGPSMVVIHYGDWAELMSADESPLRYVSFDGERKIMGMKVYRSTDAEIGNPVVA